MSHILQPLLYSVVRKLHDKRVADKKFPYVATQTEICKEVGKAVVEILDEMVEDGILLRSENVNGIKMYAPRNVKDVNNNDI